MRWFALPLIFCVCGPLAAQDPIPDTTEAWRYFPLEVGNVWEYLDFDTSPSLYGLLRLQVHRDSVIDDIDYFVVERTQFIYDGEEPTPYSREMLLRFDSLAAQVVELDGLEEIRYEPYTCHFNTPFPPAGEQLQCGPGSFDLIYGIGYDVPVQIGDDVVNTAVKTFAVYYFGGVSYAADLGYIGQSGCEGSCWDWRLTYAKVSGLEYGEPNPVANQQEVPFPPSGISLSVYPNPAAERFSITFSSSKPQQVAVKIFDLLGRRVYSDEHVAGAGETTLHLDGSDLARGIYLVRVTTADGQVATTRITRQ